MTTYIALLRAVNVAGHNKVAMADLRDLLNRTGFENARSLLQSGNLIFDGERDDTGTIEQILERASRRHLQLETDFFVRTTGDWEGKAGGYGIQDVDLFPADHPGAVPFVIRQAGSRTNIVGLPKTLARQLLAEAGVRPTEHVK